MTIHEALSRTLLLMRTDLVPDVDDKALLDALLGTRVVLRAGSDVLHRYSGQTALVTAALTMTRSGHDVWVDAADVPMLGPQPPLAFGKLVSSLARAGRDLLPGREIGIGCPETADLEICLGAIDQIGVAPLTLRLDAGNWDCRLGGEGRSWSGSAWPIGAIGAGALAAAEAFKCAMRRLSAYAREPVFFASLYRSCDAADFCLTPEGETDDIRGFDVDMVSGGAIANAALFALLRCPSLTGKMRVFDDDESALSNLNRNALLLRSALGKAKVDDLAGFSGAFGIEPHPRRFTGDSAMARHILVGVDHIPSRWAAQALNPAWLGIGATEGFSVLVSTHRPGQPCGGCLHPVDAASGGTIPTAAFVSLLSGLFLAARWLRAPGAAAPQQIFLSALRPESWGRASAAIAPNPACPVGCAASGGREAA